MGWLANYSPSSQFGLYEDDYWYTEPMKWLDFCHGVGEAIVRAPEGRPLGYVVNDLLAYASGHKQPSPELEYLTGWAILSVNGFLMYLVARRALGACAAIVAACTYLLFPADLAKQVLMHRGFAQVAVTCCFLGFPLYQKGTRGSKLLSYIVASLGLLMWEGLFLAFLVAPLLSNEKGRKRFRECLVHAALFFGILAFVLAIRFATGENRATQVVTGFGNSIGRMAAAVSIGPFVVTKAFVFRPLDTLRSGDAFSKTVLILSFSILLPTMLGLDQTKVERQTGVLLIALFGGLIAATFPNILMYRPDYFPPNVTIGRFSGEHIPAEFGFAIVLGSGHALLERRFGQHWLLVSVAAGHFSVLAAFGAHIQKTEYVTAWRYEKEIWRGVIENSADAEDGMPILIDLQGVPHTQDSLSIGCRGGRPNHTIAFSYVST